ncbi:MAG: hypothetical protein ACKVPX_01665 [Myxococcaceae bacterium]
MLRKPIFLAAFSIAVVGCRCGSSSNGTDAAVDGGDDAGSDGGNDGGGNANYYPDGGLVPPQDAGYFPPDGGFTLDGGGGSSGQGVGLSPDGGIILNQNQSALRYAWIANSGNGWVSKYDTSAPLPDGGLPEVARYYSVVPRNGVNGGALNLAYNQNNSPSRTALDLNGDVWIANRAATDGVQGSVTKIATDSPAGCIDRNGNNTIETSSDLDGDGIIETGEFIVPSSASNAATYDECVLFSTAVGNSGAGVKARGLAVAQGSEGSAGDIWVVLHNTQNVVKLDVGTGALREIQPGVTSLNIGFGGYGAAVDRLQRLWVVETLADRLAMVDTNTGVLTAPITAPGTMQNQSGGSYTGGVASYGIAIDGSNRVWLAGFTRWARAFRYDHALGEWRAFDYQGTNCQRPSDATQTALGRGRGIAADRFGNIWMSADKQGSTNTNAAQLIGFNADTGAIKQFTGGHNCIDGFSNSPATNQSIGVGLDQDDNIWINNFGGNVMKIHRDTGAVNRSFNQGGNLYSYSDFTGYQLRNFTAPFGSYRQLLQGCAPETEWRTLRWDADTPAETAIEVFLNVGNTLAEVNSSPQIFGPFRQIGPGSSLGSPTTPTFPIDLMATNASTGTPVAQGRYLRVEFRLRTDDRQTSPVLRSFSIGSDCELLVP